MAKRAANLLFLLVVLALAAMPATAADLRQLPDKVFEVSLTDAGGAPLEICPPGGEVVFNIRFGLMLSDVKDYPVTASITVGSGPTQETIEAYNGRLGEGIWLLSERVKVPGNWSPVAPYKVVLRVRMFNRSEAGTDSFYAYYTAEGSFKVGYR